MGQLRKKVTEQETEWLRTRHDRDAEVVERNQFGLTVSGLRLQMQTLSATVQAHELRDHAPRKRQRESELARLRDEIRGMLLGMWQKR
jgi:hypothetical protein